MPPRFADLPLLEPDEPPELYLTRPGGSKLDGACRVAVASTWRSRLNGLAWAERPQNGFALLLPRTRSIHTFGMRFPLDLVWLDSFNRVVRIDRRVGPNRFRTCLSASSVIEVPALRGTTARRGTARFHRVRAPRRPADRVATNTRRTDQMQEKLGIAGSGAIATGLAVTAAADGEVVLWARSDSSVERASATIAKLAGKLDDEGRAGRVTVTTDLSALADCSYVVEAIVEELEPKQALLGELNGILGDDTILASTTSSLSVAALADASGRTDRFAALHVFNPVPQMKLIELCFADGASDSTKERTRALCEALGKTAVEVPDVPGFVVNALLFPYLFHAVEHSEKTGIPAADIDTAMKLGAGHPMGPMALLDFVGLDVSAAIGDEIGAEVPQKVRDLIAEGALGRKTGRGLLNWSR